MRKCLSCLYALVIGLWPAALFSQSSSSSTAISNTIAFYQRAIGDQSGIYNGFQYYRYPDLINAGHPFFMFDTLTSGSVYYDSIAYYNVLLLYDEVIDELLTTDYRRENLVQLVKMKVGNFTIGGRKFIRITDNIAALSPGYYLQLYSGKSRVLGKEVKAIEKRIINQFEEYRNVEARKSYYVGINQQYYTVSGAKALMKLFGDKRRAVTEYLKNRRLKYKSNREDYIVEAVKHYDELSR
jgi:hypothetical protein